MTENCNEIADERRASTYVRAQRVAAGLFVQMRYGIFERINFDLSNYGVEGEKTGMFVMRRYANVKNHRGRKLDWS